MALDQLCDRGDDADERGLALAGDVRGEPAACDQHVEARRALERRAASDFEVPDAIGEGPLTIAFGDVECDRGCGLVEMLQYIRTPTARLHFVENRADPCAKGDREPISVELLMVEHSAVIGRGERRLRTEYEYEYEYEHETGDCR